jgi:hypothetical protein
VLKVIWWFTGRLRWVELIEILWHDKNYWLIVDLENIKYSFKSKYNKILLDSEFNWYNYYFIEIQKNELLIVKKKEWGGHFINKEQAK